VPILHVQYDAESQSPDGKTVQIPPRIVLLQNGPCVQVVIELAQSFAEQLVQQGQSVPQPVAGVALVDTGASTTCIDDALALSLGLPVIDVVQMTSASHAGTQTDVYLSRVGVYRSMK
jgi:predicted aspartyl protease